MPIPTQEEYSTRVFRLCRLVASLLLQRRDEAIRILGAKEMPISSLVSERDDPGVRYLVQRYHQYPLAVCEECHQIAPIQSDTETCAWGCAPDVPVNGVGVEKTVSKTISLQPIDVSTENRGKVTLEQYRQVEEFIQLLPAGAPEIWDGLPFTIGEKTWQLVAKVTED